MGQFSILSSSMRMAHVCRSYGIVLVEVKGNAFEHEWILLKAQQLGARLKQYRESVLTLQCTFQISELWVYIQEPISIMFEEGKSQYIIPAPPQLLEGCTTHQRKMMLVTERGNPVLPAFVLLDHNVPPFSTLGYCVDGELSVKKEAVLVAVISTGCSRADCVREDQRKGNRGFSLK